MPTSIQVRNRIEAIGKEFHVADIKGVPEYAEDEQYRMAFKYQLLVAGRISEVCGKYMPKGSEAFQIEFEIEDDMIPAVLFAVKNAKRKTKRG